MLTFRKSLVAAIFLVACILLLRSSSSSSSAAAIPNVQPISPEELAQPGIKTDEKHSQGQKKNTVQQLPLQPAPTAPLRDRLRYHFPYDLNGKFPAYIWQTWKYDPSSVWFIDDLRSPEASWTE